MKSFHCIFRVSQQHFKGKCKLIFTFYQWELALKNVSSEDAVFLYDEEGFCVYMFFFFLDGGYSMVEIGM